MRYEDWDVLLFPKGSKVPMKEFKTNCHVIQDADFTKDGELELLKFPQFRSELLRQSYWSPADEVGRIKIVISEGFPRDSLSVPIERVKNVIAFSFQHAPIDILESSGIAWPNPSMWRRGPFNPSMPVPTQHPEEGAEAHLHSPRRPPTYNKTTISSSGQSSGIPGLSSVTNNASTLLSSMPNTQALLQRGWSSSASVYNDPFNQQGSDDPLAFMDWSNAAGPVGYNPNASDTATPSYNPAQASKSTRDRRMTNSDISMSDFNLSNSNNPQMISDALNFAGGSLEEPGTSTQGPKVPTNTPTTSSFLDDLGIDINRVGTPGSMWLFSNTHVATPNVSQPGRHQSLTTTAEIDKQSALDTPPTSEFFNANGQISADFATSLTHSLLNQPHPLPVSAANIPLPASEVKSRKEDKENYEESLKNTPTVEHSGMRKVSQVFGSLGKGRKNKNNSNNSPPSARTLSGVFSARSTSAGEFGHDLTNITNFTNPDADAISTGIPNTDVCITDDLGSAKDAKRSRHFTPASSKVIDDADEPRRGSPQIRLFEESK
ncbi:hypothetical protein SLS62_011272 [Diatrype stigma]|uniref:Uncharacterized protein n=1 Tax=Diatrype stigma TaxID=117547 RepID=A0AAN9U4X5_9PEZI